MKQRDDGTFCLKELKSKIRKLNDTHEPVTSLICIENTFNVGGGHALPLEFIDGVNNGFDHLYYVYIIDLL